MAAARVGAITAAILLAMWSAMSAEARPASTGRSLCGVERWKVKTLQDRPSLLPVQTVTIAYLISRTKPVPLPGDRAPFERHQFKVTAQVTKVIGEDDGDNHLVLQDGAGNTMIAEAPTSSCNSDATAYRRNQMAQARAAVTVCTKAEVMVNARYPHGVGKLKAHDATAGDPVTNFKRSTTLYLRAMHYNRGLDRDKDGIACEKH
jgi:hypothetical protein